MPFRLTSIVNGSICASAVPTAANTLPQLGSPPNMAALSKLFQAHALATSTASLSLVALLTVIATVFVDPSASSIS